MRESLQGVGRDAAGPHLATHKIHDYIRRHPGCTPKEVRAAALEGDWVDRGHAHRLYANRLNTKAAKACSNGFTTGFHEYTPAEISRTMSDRAVVYVVQQRISAMMTNRALLKDEAGGLTVLRELADTHGLTKAQILVTPEENRAVVAEMELLRAVRPRLDELRQPNGRLRGEEMQKLIRWVEAKEVKPPPWT